MELQYISDIHLEFYKSVIKLEDFLTPVAPYLAILGDLGYCATTQYQDFVKQASEKFTKVFIISGNHEYYATTFESRPTIDEIDKQISETCAKYQNVYFLNNTEHHIDNTTVVLGSTLWSNIDNDKKHIVKQCQNDYRSIYVWDPTHQYKILVTVDDTVAMFNKNVQWLNESISKYSDKKIIILTHYLPSYKLISDTYKGSDTNCAYASNLDYLMENNPQILYWLCGHTHTPANMIIGSCQCCINPVGYVNESTVHNKSATVVIRN